MCHPEPSDTCICDAGADEGLDCTGRRFFTSFRMTMRRTLQLPCGGVADAVTHAIWVPSPLS
jgi:hypothetical protein